MRIGISVLTHQGQNIWENGLGQNVLFLARLFDQLPFVRQVVLIDGGDQGQLPPQVEQAQLQWPLLSPSQAADAVDVIFECAGALDARWLALQRARGKKVVYYCAGQPFVSQVEPALFDRPGFFSPLDRSDEVWLLPKDRAHAAMMRVMTRAPVRIAPYLWAPTFIEQRKTEVQAHGFHYGWQARAIDAPPGPPPPLRLAIFEPNVSVVKASSIPMLACDQAYRVQPESVAFMHVLNTLHMKDHPTLLHLANSLDLVRQHKSCFHGRHDIVGFMAQHADAVVAHQWMNDQNYAYLDALYADYPLIHNSPWLHEFGAGYYYPEFDVAKAAQQILRAWLKHQAMLPEQRAATQRVMASVDPLSRANLDAYADLLRGLCHDTPAWMEG